MRATMVGGYSAVPGGVMGSGRVAAVCGAAAGGRMRAARLLLAGVVAVCAWLAMAPTPALAGRVYPYLGRISGLSDATSVAVDDKTGDTLVADAGSEAIEVYNANRELVATWNGSALTNPPGTPTGSLLEGKGGRLSVAANNTNGDLYVSYIADARSTESPDEGVYVFGPAGEYLGQLELRAKEGSKYIAPEGIAVDKTTGYVYVVESEADHGIAVYNAKGEYQSQLGEGDNWQGVAVDDGSGRVLATREQDVTAFSAATGMVEAEWNGTAEDNPPGAPRRDVHDQPGFGVKPLWVAADEATGDVFVSDEEEALVDEFGGDGHYYGQILGGPGGAFSRVLGVSVDEASGDIYVAEGGSVSIFGQPEPVPDVETNSVADASESSATLRGSVDPEGPAVTSCEFEYGPTASYGHVVPCSALPGSGTGTVAVSAPVSGLEPYAYYHYRLVAGNTYGTVYGEDAKFVAANEEFGFQRRGAQAFSVVVSNSMMPMKAEPEQEAADQLPEVANPADPDTQAGSHPFAMTLSFRLKTSASGALTRNEYAKDIAVEFPAGFAGSIVSVPQCPMSRLAVEYVGCPTSSQVGTVVVKLADELYPAPVYNMVPSDGGTAELAFPVLIVAQPVIVTVRTDGDYGIVSMTRNITQFRPFEGLTLTLWGVPADPRHDAERYTPTMGSVGYFGRIPGNLSYEAEGSEGKHFIVNGKGENVTKHENETDDAPGEPMPAGTPLTAYLTNPTKCGGEPVQARIVGDSWADQGPVNPVNHRPELSGPGWVTASTPMYPGGITGCNRLRFNPSISVMPDNSQADSPSGYTIDLRVPQDTEPQDLASPALDNAVATLPQGLAINPGAADGLQACTGDQADPAGSAGNEIGLGSEAEPACPAASQVGSVELKTPLLPEPLLGQVYLASEHFENHYGVYIVIRGEGLLIKLHSTVVANAVTGQLTATFANNPELPFSEFVLHFYGGPRAVFVNPSLCGPATTTTLLDSWASEPGGLGDATPSSTFDVSFDGHGAACPDPQPFAPSFTAGTTSIQAGGFSPLVVSFNRPDADQIVNHVQVTTPPGLLGVITGIPLCGEPQAAQGTCSAGSQIGHVVVGVGSGAAPLYLPVPGQPENPVYLTGPYKGAPYGLAFVIPAVAGPYNLGTVVVRAAVDVNPVTSALTVTSDPLPTIIDGIPIQVKSVNVVIDRPDFIFNPTNCDPMQLSGTATSLQGSSTTISSPFQVTGCGDLKFQPQFTVSTSGHTSRLDGASLDARLSFPAGAFGKDANVASVKVELPKQLPSRLTTLQKACPQAVFHSNPGGCPGSSIVGVARASTPILPEALSGPVYFVSQGGEAFPELIIVLQGDGVRVNLVGNTFINEKTGVTSSTFKTLPDVPVNSFELYLPEGPYSALAANANLCKTGTLHIPTTMTAQNGTTIKQQTPVKVTGCTTTKTKKKKTSSKRKRKRGARFARGHASQRAVSEQAAGHGRAGR